MLLTGTYDVQEVVLVPYVGGLQIRCYFIDGSLALGCYITVCREEKNESNPQICRNNILYRPTPIWDLISMDGGMYEITEVADVERDGSINFIMDALSLFYLMEVNVSITTYTYPVPITSKC